MPTWMTDPEARVPAHAAATMNAETWALYLAMRRGGATQSAPPAPEPVLCPQPSLAAMGLGSVPFEAATRFEKTTQLVDPGDSVCPLPGATRRADSRGGEDDFSDLTFPSSDFATNDLATECPECWQAVLAAAEARALTTGGVASAESLQSSEVCGAEPGCPETGAVLLEDDTPAARAMMTAAAAVAIADAPADSLASIAPCFNLASAAPDPDTGILVPVAPPAESIVHDPGGTFARRPWARYTAMRAAATQTACASSSQSAPRVEDSLCLEALPSRADPDLVERLLAGLRSVAPENPPPVFTPDGMLYRLAEEEKAWQERLADAAAAMAEAEPDGEPQIQPQVAEAVDPADAVADNVIDLAEARQSRRGPPGAAQPGTKRLAWRTMAAAVAIAALAPATYALWPGVLDKAAAEAHSRFSLESAELIRASVVMVEPGREVRPDFSVTRDNESAGHSIALLPVPALEASRLEAAEQAPAAINVAPVIANPAALAPVVPDDVAAAPAAPGAALFTRSEAGDRVPSASPEASETSVATPAAMPEPQLIAPPRLATRQKKAERGHAAKAAAIASAAGRKVSRGPRAAALAKPGQQETLPWKREQTIAAANPGPHEVLPWKAQAAVAMTGPFEPRPKGKRPAPNQGIADNATAGPGSERSASERSALGANFETRTVTVEDVRVRRDRDAGNTLSRPFWADHVFRGDR